MKRPQLSTEGDPGSKRRRRISTSEDDDITRPPETPVFSDAGPRHKIYNSACRKEKPDELFRKDLISAMKLPDSEQLEESDFWDVSDSWKQEWERGVQVPVNSKNVPNPNVRPFREKIKTSFKLPKKFMRTTKDNFFSDDLHVLVDTAAKSEEVCKYDMDDLDSEWLKLFNEKREELGLSLLDEDTMERILEDFESQCSKRFQDALKTEKGLGIEYDEDVICDVCRSPDCEEGNEMVFCDACNICVHQACYGITAIPEGSWICRPCAANVKPTCLLCPNMGGAMKSTSSGEKWAHVSCALWIPEVNIGCPEKMEPIKKISQIPASRWALICALCRERVGACIQCSVKTCKVAYHVTCAFENGLEMEMKTTPIDSKEEGVKMQSYCEKHCKSENSIERSPPVTPKKSSKKIRKKKEHAKDKETNEVDEHNARLQKIRSLEAQFHKFVNVKDTANYHNMDIHIVDFLYCYWVLKRRAKFNKPLLITKCDETSLLIKQHENLLYSQMKMFVHLRQDLERVRNLCYMIGRREKIFRSFLRIKRDLFEKQNEILTEHLHNLTQKEVNEVLSARIGDKLFERIYCVDVPEPSEDASSKISSPQKQPNPYAKSYTNNMNTRSRRRTISQNHMDNMTDNFDSESSEMPVLTKCKSEENLLSEMKSDDSSASDPHFVKLESKSKEYKTSPVLEAEYPINSTICNGILKPEVDIKGLEYNDRETLRTNSENTFMKKKHVTNDGSNDKNLLSSSDKENINAQTPIKQKKTRTQLDLQFTDLSSQKSDVFDDEQIANDIGTSSIKKHFKLDKHKTRYQMRNRCSVSDILEVESTNHDILSDSLSSPSYSNDDILCRTPDKECVTENGFLETLCETPKRKRGRPRKIPLISSPDPDANISVIQPDMSSIKDIPNQNSCDESIDFDENAGFRMSLRHMRECPDRNSARKDGKWKHSIIIKMNHPDSTPLKEANKPITSDTVPNSTGLLQSSPEWDREDTQQQSLVEQSPSRIVIRLRKDPNRESWKNDSSSSSDVPVAFRIVRNEMEANPMSEFPPINGNDSSPNQSDSKEDVESKHRYPMRERSSLTRSVKLALGKS